LKILQGPRGDGGILRDRASGKRVIAKLAHYETVSVTALHYATDVTIYTRERTLIKPSATQGVGGGDMSKQSS